MINERQIARAIEEAVARRELTLPQQLAGWAAWIFSGWLFFAVGWFAMAPGDPFASVSLLNRQNPAGMWIQSVALAVVVVVIATLIAGRRHVDAGIFGVGIGLTAVSVRGATAEYMFLRSAEGGGEAALARLFALESLAWFCIGLIAVVVAAFVARWCSSDAQQSGSPANGHAHDAVPAACDLPVIARLCRTVRPLSQLELIEGLKHLGIIVVAGMIAFRVLSTGSHARAIEHGQACFVVAGTVWIAGYIAGRVAPVRSALWAILGVGLLALLQYAIASVGGSTSAQLPASIPSSPALRVLPIQFIGVGLAASVMNAWYMIHPDVRSESQPAERTPKRDGTSYSR